MKLIRKQATKISLLMSITFLFFSCSQNEIREQNENTTSNTNLYKKDGGKYSGEEIIEGLIFFKNEIPDGIPQLAQIKSLINQNSTPETIAFTNELSKTTIDFIKARYPNFLNELQAKMYSGNLYDINDILQKTTQYVEQAGLASPKYHSAFSTAQFIINNDAVRNEIINLDLSTEAGVTRLNQIVKDIDLQTNNNQNRLVWVAPGLAVAQIGVAVHVGVIAVSVAVAAYSVAVWAAYWGCRCSSSQNAPMNIFMPDGNLEFEKEVLISQIGVFFKP